VRDTLDVQTEVARSRLFYPYVKRVVFGEIVNAVESTPQEDKELKYDFKTRFPNEGWEHLGLRTTTYPNPKRLDLRHAPFGDDYSNTEATRYILGLNKYLIYGHERPGTPPGYHPELEHLYRLDGWSLWRSRFKGATVQDFLANKDYWERSHGDSYGLHQDPHRPIIQGQHQKRRGGDRSRPGPVRVQWWNLDRPVSPRKTVRVRCI